MSTPATEQAACPYCHGPAAGQDRVTACPVCAAAHHADCWAENGGCAVTGCAAGPSETPAVAAAQAPVAARVAAGPAPAAAPPPARSRRGRTPLIAAGVVGVLFVLGIVAVVVSGGQEDAEPGAAAQGSVGNATERLVSGDGFTMSVPAEWRDSTEAASGRTVTQLRSPAGEWVVVTQSRDGDAPLDNLDGGVAIPNGDGILLYTVRDPDSPYPACIDSPCAAYVRSNKARYGKIAVMATGAQGSPIARKAQDIARSIEPSDGDTP